jgi:hypothetical protein
MDETIVYIEGFTKPENYTSCKLTRGVASKYCCIIDEDLGTSNHPPISTNCHLKLKTLNII